MLIREKKRYKGKILLRQGRREDERMGKERGKEGRKEGRKEGGRRKADGAEDRRTGREK